MELTAAIEALRSCPDGAEIELHTDSQYVQRGITSWIEKWRKAGWKRKKKPLLNKELWMALDQENQRVTVRWYWVKAHSGVEFNEVVDQAARASAQRIGNAGSGQAPRRSPQIKEPNDTSHKSTQSKGYFLAAASSNDQSCCAWVCITSTAERNFVVTDIVEIDSVDRTVVLGAVQLIRKLQDGAEVSISTSSKYLYDGVTEWLDGWYRRGWRNNNWQSIPNMDLWLTLFVLLVDRKVQWYYEEMSPGRARSFLAGLAQQAADDALTKAQHTRN